MKPKYAVYRSRVLILNPKTKTDAIFKNKREADLLAQELNQTAGGYYTAVYYGPEYILVRDGLHVSVQHTKAKGKS